MANKNIENFFKGIEKSLLPVLNKIKSFVCRHKVLTIVVSIVVVLVLAVVIFVFDKLNRINYDDGSNPSVVYTETTAVTTSSSANGKFKTFKAADGSTVFSDGSYINTAGAGVLSDGTTIYPTGIVVFQDGTYIISSGIRVSADGIATFSDGSQLHMTLFSIRKDGRVLSKTPDGSISIINHVAEHAVINSSQGSVIFGTTAPQTTKPALDINNNSPDPVVTPTPQPPVQDFEEEEIDDIIVNVDEDIKQELENNDQAIEENRNNNEIWYSDDVINILLMGIDQGGRNYPYGRSDAMIVVSINKKTKDIKLVSFARAAYVAINGYANTRLNHAHGYGGPALAMDTIEKNYKIRIDNYISTTFEAFQQLIDCLGGVDIGLTQAEVNDETMQYVLSLQGYTDLVPGTYTLNGYSALNYVRLRKIDSDKERTQRQRNVLTALASKAGSMNVAELNSALNEILPYITTDLTKTEIIGQMMNVPSYLSGNIEQYVLPHRSSALQLIDGYEVVLVDWENEVAYTHEVFYSGVDIEYVTD